MYFAVFRRKKKKRRKIWWYVLYFITFLSNMKFTHLFPIKLKLVPYLHSGKRFTRRSGPVQNVLFYKLMTHIFKCNAVWSKVKDLKKKLNIFHCIDMFVIVTRN